MPKFTRWLITDAERAVLESVFVETVMPDPEEISSLACILNKTPRQVRVWFQNQRVRRWNVPDPDTPPKSPTLPPNTMPEIEAHEVAMCGAQSIAWGELAVNPLPAEGSAAIVDACLTQSTWNTMWQNGYDHDTARAVNEMALLVKMAQCYRN